MTRYALAVRALGYPSGQDVYCRVAWAADDPWALRFTFGGNQQDWLLAVDLFRAGAAPVIRGADVTVHRPFYWSPPGVAALLGSHAWVRLDLRGDGPDATVVLDMAGLDRLIAWADATPPTEVDVDQAIREFFGGAL